MRISILNWFILSSLALSTIFAVGCRQRSEDETKTKDVGNVDDPINKVGMGLTQHSLEAPFSKPEDMMVQGLAQGILSRITTFRDAHPKAHACVYNASLKVNESLRPEYRSGVFSSPNRILPAIVRYSSGSSKLDSDDRTQGSHGMAVKILLSNEEQAQVPEIPGEVFHPRPDAPNDLQDASGAAVAINALYKSFDIIAINGLSEFVVNDLASYPAFFKAAATGDFGEYIKSLTPKNQQIIAPLLGKLAAMKTSKLLNERYNSWVPYAFDQIRAVKYSWVPCATVANPAPSATASKNFLGENLRTDLQAQQGCFKLVAKFHDDSMPSVEDAAYSWGPADPQKDIELATLTLPAKFTSESFCQGLSFNPAHALPSQRGIGSTQRARRFIYAAIANRRISSSNQAAQP